MRSRLLVIAIAAAVWCADALSKHWALSALQSGRIVRIVGDAVVLRLTANPGAAFSLGTGVTWIFTALAAVTVLFIVSWASRCDATLWLIGLGGLAGGAAGNLTDRLTRPPSPGLGHVVDFIAFPHFPVFNVADSAIVCSVGLLLLASALDIPMRRGEPNV